MGSAHFARNRGPLQWSGTKVTAVGRAQTNMEDCICEAKINTSTYI